MCGYYRAIIVSNGDVEVLWAARDACFRRGGLRGCALSGVLSHLQPTNDSASAIPSVRRSRGRGRNLWYPVKENGRACSVCHLSGAVVGVFTSLFVRH